MEKEVLKVIRIDYVNSRADSFKYTEYILNMLTQILYRMSGQLEMIYAHISILLPINRRAVLRNHVWGYCVSRLPGWRRTSNIPLPISWEFGRDTHVRRNGHV